MSDECGARFLVRGDTEGMADDQPDAIDPEGPEDDRYKWPIIAHADVEDVDCGGCLWPPVQGDVAEIGCTECGAVVRTVPVGDLQGTYDEIELSLDSIATEICPFDR